MLWSFIWRWVLLAVAVWLMAPFIALALEIAGVPIILQFFAALIIPPFVAYGMAKNAHKAAQRRLKQAIEEGVRQALTPQPPLREPPSPSRSATNP